MKKAPNPKTFLLMTAGSTLIGLTATYFAWSGMTDQASALETARAESANQNEEDVNRQLRKSREDLAVIARRLGHLEDGVTEGAYVPTMLAELQAAGRRSGLEVLGVRPAITPPPVAKPAGAEGGAETVRKPYREMEIDIKCRGNYGAVLKFVKALGEFPKVVAARAVSLQPRTEPMRNGKTNFGTLDVQVSIRAFVFKENEKKERAGSERTASISEGSTNGG